MTATQTPGLRGRQLLRVSDDHSGQERSNEEQTEDNDAIAEDFGITSWGAPYSEVGSASRFRTRERLTFPQLLEDLRTGSFGAEVLVMWEGSRGSRDLEEWLPLLKLTARARVQIGITSMERLYKPWKGADRHALIAIANDAELESSKTSDRVNRGIPKAARKGRPHGRAPYGYQRTYDRSTGRLEGQEMDPVEGPLVQELFARLERGESLAGIARDWAARGITSRGTRKVPARPIAPHVLRSMALAPCYIGRRVNGPRELDRCVRSTTCQTYGGADGGPAWPPLVSEEQFYAVRARLLDPSRKTTRPGRGIHLLSMIATCDICGGPLTAAYRKGAKDRRLYKCSERGCTQVAADALDAYATEELLGVVTREDIVERLLAGAGSGEEVQEARAAVARLTAERAQLLARLEDADDEDPDVLAAQARRAGRQLQEAQARLEELSTPATLRGLITFGEAAREEWAKTLTMAAKRELARALFAPGALGRLSVARATPGTRPGSGPVEARVRLDGQPLSEQ